MPFDLSTAKPVEQKSGFDLSSAKPVEEQPAPQENQNTEERNFYQKFQDWQKRTGRQLANTVNEAIVSNPVGRVASEAGAGIGRSLSGTADTFVTAPINDVMRLTGKSEDELFQGFQNYLNQEIGTNQPYMKDGIGRDIVAGASEIVPDAVMVGGLVRKGIQKALPTPNAMTPTSTTQEVLRQVGNSTAAQDVAFGAASGAGSVVGEDIDQAMGGDGSKGAMIGALAAPMLPAAASSSAKRLFTGTGETRKKFVSNIDDFFASGADSPSVGQLRESPVIQQVEKALGSVPSGGPMRAAFNRTSEGIKKRLNTLADDISRVSDEELAGLTIKRGLSGKDGFVDRFLARSGSLWSNVDSGIGGSTNTRVDNIRTALDDVVKDNVLTEKVNNPLLRQLKETLSSVDEVSYQELRDFRSLIGKKLSSSTLVDDIDKADLKRIYGAITEDIKVAAEAKNLLPEFNRANKYTRVGHQRIDDFLQGINKKVETDKIFDAVIKGGEGVSKINAVKRSLKPQEWEVVTSNLIRRMGRPNAGSRNADQISFDVDDFSIDKFVSDWNRLGKAKKAIFSGSEKINQYRTDLDKIASVAGKLKNAGKEGANPSGTGQSLATLTAVGAGASLNPTVIGTVLGVMTANNMGTRLLTNKNFVHWLASSANKNFERQLPRLAIIASQSDLEEAMAINDFIEAYGSDQ